MSLPGLLTGLRAQRNDGVVPGHEVDVIAIERDAAFALSVVGAEGLGWRQWMPVFPEEIAIGGIDCLDHVTGITQIHHAVVDEGRGLVNAGLHAA
jgi:hypothetical protein